MNNKVKFLESIEVGIADLSLLAPPAGIFDHFVEEHVQLDVAQKAKHVYACYGLTMSFCHELEGTLGGIAILHARASGRATSPKDVEAFEASFDRLTIGAMLADVRKRVIWSDEVDALFKDALERRNQHAHGFFFKRSEAMMSELGQRALLKELSESAYSLRTAILALDIIGRLFFKLLGVPAGLIDDACERYLARYRT